MAQGARHADDFGVVALCVLRCYTGHVFTPEHGEVGLHHLGFGGQVEPYLEQLGRVGLPGLHEREHFAVHNALAGGEPLHIAPAKAGRSAQRIGVVNQSPAGDGDGFKPPVWVRGEAGNGLPVVHAPAVFLRKVLAQITPVQRRIRPHGRVAARVGVVVVHAEQERIQSLPGEAQGLNTQYG